METYRLPSRLLSTLYPRVTVLLSINCAPSKQTYPVRGRTNIWFFSIWKDFIIVINLFIFKKKCCEGWSWRPHNLRLFGPLLIPLFMSIRIQFSVSYSMLSYTTFTPRLANCTNIRMPLSLCKWTVFTSFTCSYTLTRINRSRHLSPLTCVGKPLRERAPRITRRICEWYARRSPHHSCECVNVVSELSETNFTGQVVIKLSSVCVFWGAYANYSYFDTCNKLRASAASACNWASYRTFDVMVLKCTHYTTLITLNVLQTGCTVASQLRFEPSSLVWRASSLPIRPSPAYFTNLF